jgi:uncharacterized Zn finger protein (UPF0148 family)
MATAYENAPGTQLLATHCAACGRPLLDAQSVEIGMGPDCRKRFGYGTETTPELRAAANRLIHRIAVRQAGLDVARAADELRALGFPALAQRVLERVTSVRITEAGPQTLRVAAPYLEAAIPAWRQLGRWDRDAKAYLVPLTARAALWRLLRAYYAGHLAHGPRGAFMI